MKLKLIPVALLLSSTLAFAQTSPHSATLTWTAPADATAQSTATILRAPGACTGTPTFTSLATGQAINKPYVDSTVTVGTFCYAVQHVLGGAASVDSNLAPATVSPLPVTTLTVTVQ